MLSVRNKLTIVFSVLIAILFAQFALVYYFSGKSALLINQAIDANDASNAVGRLAIEGQKLRRYEKEYFIYADNPKKREKYSSEWQESYAKLKEGLALLLSHESSWSESDKAKADTWDDSLNAYASGFHKVEAAVTGGIIQGTLDANKAIQDAKNQFRVFLKGTAAEVETKLGEARHASTQLQDNFANVQKLLIGLSFTGLLIGAVILFTIPGSIARPITELTESVTDISKGNITRPVSVRGSHEVKALAESVERLRVAVKGLMTRMNKLQQRQNESKRQSFA
jgi:methyl-accepting chemotaxis protein